MTINPKIIYQIVKGVISIAASTVIVTAATPAIEEVFKVESSDKGNSKKPVIPCNDIEENEIVDEESYVEV